VYHIKISNPLDLLIEDMGFSMGSSKKLNYVKAPMPGIIIDIPVKKGDAVKEGDVLLVLEAMKMENAIICQKNSSVKEVYAAAGDKVEKGKLIIELE
jgi:biotin carboxyl carrier protein